MYLLKVGCISYGDNDESWIIKDWELIERLESPNKIFQETAEALKKHPHVFDLTIKVDEDTSMTWTNKHVFINAGFLKLRIEQPKRFQKYNAYSNSKTIEKFDAISNGATFIAYAPIFDVGEGSYIAHEFREIVSKQINKETKYSNPILGPCPIHPDIYLVFIDPIKDEQESWEDKQKPIELIWINNDLILLIDSKLQIKDDILLETLYIMNDDIIEFYRLMAIRSELLSYNNALHKLFTNISTKTIQRLNTPWYSFLKLQKLNSEVRKSLSSAYVLFVEYDNMLLTHTRVRESYKVKVQENKILRNISSYLLENTRHDSEMPNSFKDSIGHFESEIHLFNNLRAVLLASIFGAIIGAILTSILTVALTNNTKKGEIINQSNLSTQTLNVPKKEKSLTDNIK